MSFSRVPSNELTISRANAPMSETEKQFEFGGWLKNDVRRMFECPVCKRHRRGGGDVIAIECDCQVSNEGGSPVFMKLVQDEPHKRKLALPDWEGDEDKPV